MKIALTILLFIVASCATTKNEQTLEKIEKKEVKAEKKETATMKTQKVEAVNNETSNDDIFKKTICKSNGDERKISIIPQNPSGCLVSYTKFGDSQTIANAVNETSVCENVYNKVKGNLEKAGFSCQ